MVKKIKQALWLFAIISFSNAQVQQEVAPPDYIKSIVFKGNAEGDQFPIVRLGEPVYLSFDDLTASEEDYYYKIEHCNVDWTPSNLVKPQYLDGLDNQRIITYQNSVATLQPFSNYQLEIPNRLTRLKLPGNYILKIFNRFDELVFSRRFIVYTDAVTVTGVVKRTRDLNYINEKQTVQFTITSNGIQLVNPQQEVKVAIIQNYQFATAITGLRPQFYSGNQLIYRYDKETLFDGGNEYNFFENKEIRVANNGVAHIERMDIYHHYLYTDAIRAGQPYTFNPDRNGDFFINTLDGSDNNLQADYAWVHFSLPYDETIGLNKVYVYGKFNNYELSPENQLVYNPGTNLLETKILLKQGFYNYKYVVQNQNGKVDYNFIDGNRFETENNYLIVVYYRNFGDLYDSVIGIGNISSVNISN